MSNESRNNYILRIDNNIVLDFINDKVETSERGGKISSNDVEEYYNTNIDSLENNFDSTKFLKVTIFL
jgi:hypothetical protein